MPGNCPGFSTESPNLGKSLSLRETGMTGHLAILSHEVKGANICGESEISAREPMQIHGFTACLPAAAGGHPQIPLGGRVLLLPAASTVADGL